jgi:hypothetical protein
MHNTMQTDGWLVGRSDTDSRPINKPAPSAVKDEEFRGNKEINTNKLRAWRRRRVHWSSSRALGILLNQSSVRRDVTRNNRLLYCDDGVCSVKGNSVTGVA